VARGAGPVGPPEGGSSTPTPEESRQAEAQAVQKRVQTWRLESLGERRVAIGVDDYFKTYRRVLEHGMGTPPPGGGSKHGDLSAGQRWVNAWLDALGEAESRKEARPRGEWMPDTNVQDVTGRMDELVANQLGPMATQVSMVGNRLLQRALTTFMPVAVVRIVQRADGSIASTELVASSGEKKFDAYVLEHAALALAAMPAPPTRTGAGLHPDGTRSDWAFFRNGATCGVALLRVY